MPTMPFLSRSFPRRRPLLVWAVLCGAWLIGLAFLSAAPVAAQDEDAAKAADVAGPVPKPADAGAGVAPKVVDKTYLQWAIEASGPIGAFIVVLSLFFTAHVIRLFLEFRVSEAVPP